jgi:hypothetical protein
VTRSGKKLPGRQFCAMERQFPLSFRPRYGVARINKDWT